MRTNSFARSTGFWSATLCALLFLIFTICFMAIALTQPLYTWNGMDGYLAHVQANNPFFKQVAQASMLLFAPLFVVLVNSIHSQTPDDKKLLSRCALHFAVPFATLVSAHSFIQLSVVRLAIHQGQTDGLALLIQTNPLAVTTAIDVLGFSLFLGLASLCIAPLFAGGRREQVIAWAFWLNGIVALWEHRGSAIGHSDQR